MLTLTNLDITAGQDNTPTTDISLFFCNSNERWM